MTQTLTTKTQLKAFLRLLKRDKRIREREEGKGRKSGMRIEREDFPRSGKQITDFYPFPEDGTIRVRVFKLRIETEIICDIPHAMNSKEAAGVRDALTAAIEEAKGKAE